MPRKVCRLNRHPDPWASPAPAAGRRRQLRQLLIERHRALRHEWQLSQVLERNDDDLLPARLHAEEALVQVGLAFERMRGGAYGSCRGCGGVIDFQRLLALPTAERCWPCQQAVERRERADSQPRH